MTYKTYADVFWGGDLRSCKGYEALTKRNQETKKMLQEFEEYMKKRSKIETEYSKSLQNLAKIFQQRDETGVIEATLNKLKYELEMVAQCHQKAAGYYQQKSEHVKKFKEEQAAKRKMLEETLNRAQNSKITQLKQTEQLEKTYVRKHIERDTMVTNQKEINKKLELSTEQSQALLREIEKAKNKAEKAQVEAENAESNYKCAVKVLEDCRKTWEKEMIKSCHSIQELDEEKIKFLRNELWITVNVVSKLALDTDSSCEAVREILEKCDIVSDIQAFIETAKTGEHKPEPFVSKPYTSFQTSDDADSNGNDSAFHVYYTLENLEDPAQSKAVSPSPSNSLAKAALGRGRGLKKKGPPS